MLRFLIHLLAGYTSAEYNQLSLEIDSLNNTLSIKTDQIDELKKENKDLQTQIDSLSKIKDSFIIHVDGGKVWIENE